MISETLSFLAAEMNAYLNLKVMAATPDPRIIVGNIARAQDSATPAPGSIEDKGVLTLVNIEEDRTVRRQETVVKTATTARTKNPPILLNLYVLFSVNRSLYPDGLALLGHMVQFFQHQNHFTPLTHPGLDPRIEKLTVELYTMTFEQVNHLWSVLGGKYLPSALYKVRQLTLDEGVFFGESGLIREIRLDGNALGALP